MHAETHSLGVMILTFVFHLQYCHSGRARSTIREFTIRSRSSGNIPSSRRRPTGANIRAPHPPRIPFAHALAWEKGKRGEGGALILAPMGLRRDEEPRGCRLRGARGAWANPAKRGGSHMGGGGIRAASARGFRGSL